MTDEEVQLKLAPVRAATIALAFIPPVGTDAISPVVFTGFCVDCEGVVFWITAAHVFDELDRCFELFPEGNLYLRGMSSTDMAVLFRRDPDLWTNVGQTLSDLHKKGGLQIYGDPVDPAMFESMDAGLIELPELYVKGLRVGGLKPLPIASLSIPDQNEVDGIREGELDMRFFVHGALAETVEKASQRGDFKYNWCTLPLEPEDWTSLCLTFKPLWTADQMNGGVKGMSGGPIAMLGFEDLHIVAVQSSQLTTGRGLPKELRTWDIRFVRQMIEELCKVPNTPSVVSESVEKTGSKEIPDFNLLQNSSELAPL